MNLDYIAFDKLEDNNFVEENKVKYCSFDDLIKKSDILSIHLSLSDKTRGLIDSNALEKMKPTAVLINTSRGECINEDALIKALDEKLLAGAGLDVYSNEPYKGSLLEYDNVICTPHIGAYAREIRVKMEIEAVENLIKGLANE
jgi:D-3-phosphoglycerate dehydrogenase